MVSRFTSTIASESLETLDRASLTPTGASVGVDDLKALVPHPTDGTVFGIVTDGSIVRIEAESGRVLQTKTADLDYDVGQNIGGALSPDGARLVVQQAEGGVRLLNTDTFEWVGETSPIDVGDVSFAPDGDHFASISAGWIRIWDGRTGAYRAGIPLPADTGGATVSYLPEGNRLLVSAMDGRTWIVDTRTATWIERACQIAGRNLTQNEWQQYFPDRPYEVTCQQWPVGA